MGVDLIYLAWTVQGRFDEGKSCASIPLVYTHLFHVCTVISVHSSFIIHNMAVMWQEVPQQQVKVAVRHCEGGRVKVLLD